MRLILAVCLSAFLSIGLAGCIRGSAKSTQPSGASLLEPQVTLKFNDIPVPVGFKLKPEASYSFESAGVRVGLLKYEGKSSPDQVVSFYKEQMPMFNWNLLNAIEYGQRLLNFERETESCIVSLIPRGKGSTLTISVGPKSQLPKKKGQEKPIK